MANELTKAISQVQKAVVVPKSKYNEYGGFYYRSFEDIVEALKVPCEEAGIGYYMEDEAVQVGDRYYIKATVHVYLLDGEEEKTATGYARETESKKGSDTAQITGMASSYARKYALCGMFAIDGSSDPDATKHKNETPQSGPFIARCRSCGTRYQFPDQASYDQFVQSASCCPSPLWEIE